MLVVASVALWAAGCATKIETPSGRPEVTLPRIDPGQAKAALLNIMVNSGFRVAKDSQFQIAFERPTQNMAATLLLSTGYSGAPNERLSFDIAPAPGGVRVIGDSALVSNAGTAFEKRLDVTAGIGRELLDQALAQLRGATATR